MQLTEFTHALLDRHGILHWLDWGSLLGGVRDGHLIPWDEDVDMGILAVDLPAVLALAPEIQRAGHYLDASDPFVVRIKLNTVNTQHVDIYPWRNENGTLSMRWYEGEDWPGMTGQYGFPIDYIEHLGTVVLDGREFPAPSPVERFLINHRYGPGFRTPLRPVYDKTRYPDIRPEELTDLQLRLFEAIAARESELLVRERDSAGGRFAGVYAWERWIWSGRPRRPRPAHVERLRREWAANGDTDALADELLESLAALEQGIQEEASKGFATRLRRMGRRGIRLARKGRRAFRGWIGRALAGT